MPNYAYICTTCGHKVDIMHKPDETKKKCPACGYNNLRRDYSTPPAFHAHLSPMHPRANRGRGY
jgi:putative FmdB family regulatory protein